VEPEVVNEQLLVVARRGQQVGQFLKLKRSETLEANPGANPTT
jgi:hypothetical protein